VLTIFLLSIFLICVAMLWNEGMWSNAITLVNVTLACLIAVNYFEPLAAMLDRVQPDYTYLWDFLMLWALFALTYGLLRLVTDFISRHRVRFKMPVEHAGRVIFAVWVAWSMVGFTAMSLHLAPLGPHPFRGAFQRTPTSGNFLGMAPDRQWLALTQKVSHGALSRGDKKGDRAGYHPLSADVEANTRTFDPQSDFVIRYYNRRANFDKGRKKEGATGPMMLRVRRKAAGS
jgi:hypothetical protein